MTERVPNYPADVADAMKAAYVAATDAEGRDRVVADLAKNLDKKPASIRAKLSSLGVYVAKARAVGAKSAKKADVVAQIASAMGVEEEEIGSLEKATKVALQSVLDAVT